MGTDSVFSDLCVLKVKILEIFEDLMGFDGFSDTHEEGLHKAFNFLEESLAILSEISVQIKSESVVKIQEADIWVSNAENDKLVKVEETETENVSFSKKRKIKAGDEIAQINETAQESIPAAKRGRRSQRKSVQKDTGGMQKENQKNKDGIIENTQKSNSATEASKSVGNGEPKTGDVLQVADETDSKENIVLSLEIPSKKSPKKRGRPRKDTQEGEISFKVNEQIECEKCGRTLCSATELTDHECRPDAQSEAPYKCDKCDIMFNTKDVILNHISNHKDKVSTSCLLCGKTFKFACLLRDHTHGEEGNFGCTQCDKVFTYKKQYTHHMSTHKAQPADSVNETKYSSANVPFSCPECYIVIKSACNIKRHMDLHKEKQLSCTICGKRFTRSDHLGDHMKIHTGARPSICELCGKGCLNTSDLKRHLRIHTGYKPYVCPVCERGFTQKCTLDKHMKLHEKKQNAPKVIKSNSTTKPTAGPAQYTYKQMMKDLGKTPEKIPNQQVVKIEYSVVEEKTTNEGKDSKQENLPSTIASHNLSPKIMRSPKPKSPAQAVRPQLFSLLTGAKTLVPPVGGKGKHLVPSVQSAAAAPSVGENTQQMQMVQTEDGSTHIILPDSMDVGQEILVFVDDKSAESDAQPVIGQARVAQEAQESIVQDKKHVTQQLQVIAQEVQEREQVTQESQVQQVIVQESVAQEIEQSELEVGESVTQEESKKEQVDKK